MSGLDNTLAVATLLARPDQIHREYTDIDTLIRVTMSDMPEAERKRINVHLAASTRTASMDMSLMRLALRNLLSNALKFSPPASPVQLSISDSDDPLAVVLDVRDCGPGIRAELLPTLFSRGARSKGMSAGHGLGLYIVGQVMSLHGGVVELLQTGANGTTFRMFLVQSGVE